jgi:hypothetical protein
MTEPVSLEPSIALCAYAEPLASNRRVLVFGNALSALSVQLMERGARSVHVARNRSTQISFSSLADSDLSLQAGAFELCLIDDLGAFDAVTVVKKAKRAVGPRGVAVVACPNPEATTPLLRSANPSATALDYYALYDVVAAEFEHVRMLGQTPFVGYAIADFSASGEPEPALDTSFLPRGAEEPDLFIALASNHEVRLDEFSVIQLPTKRLLSSLAAPPAPVAPVAPVAPAAPVETGPSKAELDRLNQWIKELESRSSTADERADHAETELEELRALLETERAKYGSERAKGDAERVKLEAERAKADAERVKADAERAHADAERSKVEAERARADAERAKGTAERAKADAERLAAAKASSDKELATLRAQLAERDRQIADQRSEVEQASKSDLAELERQLVERGAEIRKLEQDLRTAERTGRELVRELARSNADQSKAANAELQRSLAEREANLQAATWTIESLSLRLELAGKSGTPDAPPPETAGSSPEAR